jgi:hypothetical protein
MLRWSSRGRRSTAVEADFVLFISAFEFSSAVENTVLSNPCYIRVSFMRLKYGRISVANLPSIDMSLLLLLLHTPGASGPNEPIDSPVLHVGFSSSRSNPCDQLARLHYLSL